MNDQEKITAVLISILESAMGGGLSESDAEYFFDSIVECWLNLNEDFPTALVAQLADVMNNTHMCARRNKRG